jgi:hypothetical protein
MAEYTPYDDEVVRIQDQYTDADLGADRVAREVVDLGGGEEYFAEDRDQVYCRHGKYIGYPGGVDYICPYCEDGADILAYALRYNIDINWDPNAPQDEYSTIIRCWSQADLERNLDSLRFLMGAALKGSVAVRVVTIRYAFWTNIEPEVRVPVNFVYFEEELS